MTTELRPAVGLDSAPAALGAGGSGSAPVEPDPPVSTGPRLALALGLAGLAVNAFVLRVLLSGQPSAYMDEATFVLIGRTLIERQAVYARALDWTYGSYLWPLIAGSADLLGGLGLVRAVAAGLGTVMVLATALTTARLLEGAVEGPRRWVAALAAGGLMTILPTAIGVGRFGTYDGLAGAAFMSGIACLAPGRRVGRFELLAGAGLLFVAFLAKYLVAIFLPSVCLYFLLSGSWPPLGRRRLAPGVRWLVLPLTAGCALYILLFQAELLTLLEYSLSFTDLASADPLREYLLDRPELWALAALAALGWARAGRWARRVALAGAGSILVFQALSRADADFWKHSIYLIFFLAPLAGLALAPTVEWLLGLRQQGSRLVATWRTPPLALAAGLLSPVTLIFAHPGLAIALFPNLGPPFQAVQTGLTETLTGLTSERVALLYVVAAVLALLLAPLVELLWERRVARWRAHLAVWRSVGPGAAWRVGRSVGLALVAGVGLAWALGVPLAQSSRQLGFYPNLTAALAAIQTHTADADAVLVDDSAVRYYLYPRLSTDRVTDPFAATYQGLNGFEAYRQAIADRYYDAIVLDGGIGPIGRRPRAELGRLIPRYYERVYVSEEATVPIEIYRRRAAPLDPSQSPVASGAIRYRFDQGLQDWGGHPKDGNLEPGRQVAVSRELDWEGHASLEFTITDEVSLVGVKRPGSVSRVRAQLYAVPRDDRGGEIRLGMMGFDSRWSWQDDGFRNVLPPNEWTEVVWELTRPGAYNQLGFKLQPERVATVYLGEVVVEP